MPPVPVFECNFFLFIHTTTIAETTATVTEAATMMPAAAIYGEIAAAKTAPMELSDAGAALVPLLGAVLMVVELVLPVVVVAVVVLLVLAVVLVVVVVVVLVVVVVMVVVVAGVLAIRM